MKYILRIDTDGTKDRTLKDTYNDEQFEESTLEEYCRVWADEDDDGTQYIVVDTGE